MLAAARRGGLAVSHRGSATVHVPPLVTTAAAAAATTACGGPRVVASSAFSAEPGGSPVAKEGDAGRQPMHPLVRDLFKRFIYVGRDYPLPPPYVRDKAREAILKNAHLTDTREVRGEGEGVGVGTWKGGLGKEGG